MMAFTYEMLAKVRRGQGETEEVHRLRDAAEALAPYSSKATGVPPMALFTKQEVLPATHTYLFRPW